LDNASSFHILAPNLIQKLASIHHPTDVDVVALDHVGHGKSQHKSPDGTMIFTEFAYYVAETMKFLQWDQTHTENTSKTTTTLIGHSMGSGIALLYAAVFPEQLDRLVLLDGVGPMSRPSFHVAKHVRASIEKRITSNPTLFPNLSPDGESKQRQRVYSSLDSAIEARMSTNYAFQDKLYMSRDAAKALVLRGTRHTATDKDSAVVFSHDQRLKWPSIQYFTREQVEALYQQVTCPTCLLVAQDGWLIQNEEEQARAERYIPNLSMVQCPGSHHFHADPDTAPRVLEHVIHFLTNDVKIS
jgi:pimeloyl-ACP methyl ester carboxylesterase